MKKLIAIFAFILSASLGHGQQGNTVLIRFPGVPSGDCSAIMVAVDDATGDYYDCDAAGNWFKVGPGGGGGVNSVTGSLPISSSGGANPDISISQSGVATNGYLSFVDWGIFNGKQPLLSSNTCPAGDFFSSFASPNTFTCTTPPGGTFPRLDQVLDPTADKTFDMFTGGNKRLTFLYSGATANTDALVAIKGDTSTTERYFYVGPDMAPFTTTYSAVTFLGAKDTPITPLIVVGQQDDPGLFGITSMDVIAELNHTSGSGISGTALFIDAHTSGVGGSSDDVFGIDVEASNRGGTLTNATGILVESGSAVGSIGTRYGLRINNQTNASTNYAIKTGLGLVDFGDSVKGASTINAVTGFQVNSAAAAGKVLIGDGTNFVPGDPLVQGLVAHDAPDTSNPVLIGGYASAAAPADVSGDGDAVNTWHLRNGSLVTNLATAGTLYDARQIRALSSGTDSVAVSGTATVSGTVTANQGGAPWTSRLQDGVGATLATVTAGNALKVDGSAVTQPVSIAATVGVTQSTSPWVVDGSGVTQPVSGTFWQTTQPVSGADGSVFVRQATGTNLHTVVDSGSITATQATGTNLHTVTDATSVTTATLNAETTKVIGTVRNLGNAGAIFDGATGAAPPANVIYAGGVTSGATGGLLTGIPVCDSFATVNVTTATTTLIVTGVANRHVRICSMSLVTGAANGVAFISGTGATCGTGTTAMNGGTTAASGWNFGANGGLTQGSGIGVINQTNAAGDSVCVVTSAATQLSGRLSYAIY